jgi:hypothetical protein
MIILLKKDRRMKGKIKIAVTVVSLLTVFGAANWVYATAAKESTFLLKEQILPESLKMLPITPDFRNYFVLQSLANSTSIIIGDFSGADKVISMITDTNYDGKHDKVIEYYPDSVKITYPSKPSSQFYSSFEKTEEDIINGTIFSQNYSYKMLSINVLKERIKNGKDIYPWRYGYNIKVFDPDNASTMMGEYFFSRKDGLYTLIFATYYYKLYKTRITPPLYYSVYCSESKDPKIKDVVDSLYRMMPATN